jgi:hypothetical protein
MASEVELGPFLELSRSPLVVGWEELELPIVSLFLSVLSDAADAPKLQTAVKAARITVGMSFFISSSYG